MTAPSPRRQAFLAWLEAQLGKPYLWGGRGMRCTLPIGRPLSPVAAPTLVGAGHTRSCPMGCCDGSNPELFDHGGLWPALGPDGMYTSPYEGWDCGGLGWDGLHQVGGPDLRLWDTDMAWAKLEPVATPTPGDLAFYAGREPSGPNDVQHVEVVVDVADRLDACGFTLRGWRTIGASGGGRTTTMLEVARAQGARVQYREHHLLRSGFCGFRRLPGMEP